jgi:hypothetical protein
MRLMVVETGKGCGLWKSMHAVSVVDEP